MTRVWPRSGRATTLPARTSSLGFVARFPSIRMWPSSTSACASVRLFAKRMKKRKRSILKLACSLAPQLLQLGEGVRLGLRACVARGMAPTPAPAVARLGEADVGHQPGNRLLVEADGRRQLGIERAFAADGADPVR